MPIEHRVARFLIQALLAAALAGCAIETPIDSAKRPADWATPLDVPELHNLYRVDANLYRSEQPSLDGLIKAREQLGVKTVINLNGLRPEGHRVARAGLDLQELKIKTWHIEDEDVVQVLRILRERENGPFLLHCRHGADRTGVMTAMYRIVEQGWTKEQALDEMRYGGFGFHPVWQNIVRYVQDVDIDSIRAQVAATDAAPAP